MKVRLLLAYRGTEYHGWQYQPRVPTVEGALRTHAQTFLNLPLDAFKIQGASRTDAGVHAFAQTVHIEYEGVERKLRDFVRGLNRLTPRDIIISRAEWASETFNARHSARGKLYRYQIWNHQFAHPMLQDRAWHISRPLNVEAMAQAAQKFLGEHDFSAFRAGDCQGKTTVRTMRSMRVEQDGPNIFIWVEGTAFLKYMVRIISGTLVKVGLGQAPPSLIDDLIASGDRHDAGMTAPSNGLTLMRIDYPNDPWDDPQPFLGGVLLV